MALFTKEEEQAFMTMVMDKLSDAAVTALTDIGAAVAQKIEEEVEKFIATLHPETFVPKFFAAIHQRALGYLAGLQKAGETHAAAASTEQK